MVYVNMIFQVQDFNKWKTAFDSNTEARKKGGLIGGTRVLQDVFDPKKIVIFAEWENKEKAKEFFSSDALKQRMKDAGVIGVPTVHILNEK